MVPGEDVVLGMPTSHEVRVYELDRQLSPAQQAALMRQVARVGQHFLGLISREFFFAPSSGKWVEHATWRLGCEPAIGSVFSGPQAEAILSKLGDLLPLSSLVTSGAG